MIVGNHEVHLRFRGYLGGTVNRPLGSLSVYNNSQVVGFIKRPLNIKLLLKMIMKLFVFFFKCDKSLQFTVFFLQFSSKHLAVTLNNTLLF